MMQGRIYYGIGFPHESLPPLVYLERDRAEQHLEGLEPHLATELRLLTVQVISVEPGDRAEREARRARADRDTMRAPPLADEAFELGGGT